MAKAVQHLVLGLVAASASLAGPVAAQAPPQPAARPRADYSRLSQLPNWTGVWAPDWAYLFGPGAPPKPDLTPPAAAKLAAFEAAREKGENLQGQIANCLPPGMPGIMRMPYPIEFVFTPNAVYVITETFSQVRRIYTDGRALPDDPDPFFNGHSIGRWEGETLVVETIGLNSRLELRAGIHPTEQTRIEERIHLVDPGRILIETTITDPGIFTSPYSFRQAYLLKPDWEIREYICEENNRDSADEFGRPSMDIE